MEEVTELEFEFEMSSSSRVDVSQVIYGRAWLSVLETCARCGRWSEVASTSSVDWMEEIGLGKIMAEKFSYSKELAKRKFMLRSKCKKKTFLQIQL